MERTIIKVKHSVRKELMGALGVTYPTIRGALNGTTDTELARKIRKAALAKGGVELKIVEK